jgi:defect-in-organelle-trafficking protein DotC
MKLIQVKEIELLMLIFLMTTTLPLTSGQLAAADKIGRNRPQPDQPLFSSSPSRVNFPDADMRQGTSKVPNRLKELKEIKNVPTSINESGTNPFANIRLKSIRQAALTIGSQGGAAWRYQQINKTLQEVSGKLNELFNFSPLMLRDGKIKPPVIALAEGSIRRSDTRAVTTGTTWKIIERAEVIAEPPSWRDYLIRRQFKLEASLNSSLKPRNNNERETWKRFVERGWKRGVQQANRVFQSSVNALMRDFNGMLFFRILHQQQIVSVPRLARGELGISVQGRRLDVDQKIFRLSIPAEFQPVDRWKPVVGTEELEQAMPDSNRLE